MSNTDVKFAVRKRDGNRCTACGITGDEYYAARGRVFDVHRKVPGSPYTVDGCVTLCRSCHGAAHAKINSELPRKPPVKRYRMVFHPDQAMRRAISIHAARHGISQSEAIMRAIRHSLAKELRDAKAAIARDSK